MFKKTLSLVTLVAFLLFDWACYSIRDVPVTSVTSKDRIVGVTNTSGKHVQFPKENPAHIVENKIVLQPSNSIALSDVKSFKQDDKGVIYEFTTKGGNTIREIDGKKQGWKIIFPTQKYKPDPIPLSEVKLISVRRFNLIATLWVGWGVFCFLYPIYLAMRGINVWWLMLR